MSVLERMVRAVQKVRERLVRACAALEAGGVRYAVIGGNAVAAWVATVDEAAVLNTRDADILVEPDDFDQARDADSASGAPVRKDEAGEATLADVEKAPDTVFFSNAVALRSRQGLARNPTL